MNGVKNVDVGFKAISDAYAFGGAVIMIFLGSSSVSHHHTSSWLATQHPVQSYHALLLSPVVCLRNARRVALTVPYRGALWGSHHGVHIYVSLKYQDLWLKVRLHQASRFVKKLESL